MTASWLKTKSIATCVISVLLTTPAVAEVIDSGAGGFTIQFSRTIDAPVEQVYRAVTDSVSAWWIDAHTWHGSGAAMQLDAKAGGCFCEIIGQQQTMHMQVARIVPNSLVRMLGGLGPLQGEGLHGVLDWRMQAATETTTEFTLFYRVGGYSPNDLSQWAEPVDAVMQQQITAMQNYVEALN